MEERNLANDFDDQTKWKEITPEKLIVSINEDSVTIGANTITKETYNKYKEVFETIIESGDVAWNNKIYADELNTFIKTLEKEIIVSTPS